MLQQTRVEAVKPYFQRFMEVLPDLESLAQAEEQILLKLWEGLGYYNRARNLQKAAQQALSEYGGLPSTAGGIDPFAGNRALHCRRRGFYRFRQTGACCGRKCAESGRKTDGLRWDISKDSVKKGVAEALVPSVVLDPAAFNQAVMELGATVCLPNGAPKCGNALCAVCVSRMKWEQSFLFPCEKSEESQKRYSRRRSFFWN